MKFNLLQAVLVVLVLVTSQNVMADKSSVWLDIQLKNAAENIVFQFPPILIDDDVSKKIELSKLPVVSAYSQSRSFMLLTVEDFVAEKQGGNWVFSTAFDVLLSQTLSQGLNEACKVASLKFVNSKAEIKGGDVRCQLNGKQWQLDVRYWRSNNQGVAEKNKKKSSWWEVKPASEKAKKRMNKI
jgi:hypothetical protein